MPLKADNYIYDILKLNIKANNIQNINPICKAVYNNNGNVMLYPVQDFKKFDSYGSYGLDPNANEGRKVETITIDSLNIQEPISFMKVDVQGSDLFVLEGAIETIKRLECLFCLNTKSNLTNNSIQNGKITVTS